METSIAENIRIYRKQLGLTQEQLAETMGVSTGAVYKWEAKASMPELRMLMELADFFDISVDTLLGYQMKDNRLNAAVERLRKASCCQDYDALSDAEKAIRKYPHSFDVVYAAANLYYTFGAATRKEMTNAHDILGKTAMDAVENVLRDKDPGLRKLWAKVTGPEDRDVGCRRTACKPKGENRND